jgi:hypothetical protein
MQDLRQRRPARTSLAQPGYRYRGTLGHTLWFLATWN